jgi:HEAT repeat protein
MMRQQLHFIIGMLAVFAFVGETGPRHGVAGEPPVILQTGSDTAAPMPRYGGRTLDEWQEFIKETPHDVLANPETIDGLIQIMQDREAPWANRRQAALTLGRIGQPATRAVPLLREFLLNSEEPDPQATTLWALKGLALMETVAEPATEDVVRIVLDEGQPHLVRVNAIDTLGRVGRNHPRTLPALQQILKATRSAKAAAGDAVNPALKELRMTAAAGLWYLKRSAAPALPELIRAAQDPWPLLRLEAVRTIGEIGPAAEIAVPVLIDLVLLDDAEEVRETAADALGQIGPAALNPFRRLIDDEDEQVRRLVIRGLSHMPGELSIQGSDPGGASVSPERILAKALEDPSAIVRVEAAALLARRVSEPSEAAGSAMEILLSGVNARDRETRITAYRALQEQIGRLERHRSRLEAMVQDQALHPHARTAAEHLLKLLQMPDGTDG